MTVEHVGSLTPGECLPLALQAQLRLNAALTIKLPEIQAKIAGLLAAKDKLAVELPSVDRALDIAAKLALSPPSLNLQLTAIAALLAELQAELAQIQADLAFCANLGLIFGTPGVHLYVFEGQAEVFGPEMANALQTLNGQRLVGAAMLASDSGAIGALRLLYGLSS